MITIAPSILAADFMDLGEDITALNSEENLWLHLDIMDGHFVPNLSFGAPVIKDIHKITKHLLDAHLMVTNPEFYIDSLSNLNIYNFTYHFEAVEKHDQILSSASKKFKSVGISIKPNTPVSSIPLELFSKLNLVLVMSVEPGFGGQSFMENSIKKVQELAEIRDRLKLNFVIQVDGGINHKNSPLLIKAGANNLVAGSYIFKEEKENYKNKINALREL